MAHRPKWLKIINLTEENTEKSLCDLGLGKNFLDTISNLMSIKEQMGTFTIKMKTYALQKILNGE